MGLTRNQYLAEMGIQVWVTRPEPSRAPVGSVAESAESRESLSPLDRIRRSVAVPEPAESPRREKAESAVSQPAAAVTPTAAPQFSLVFAEFIDLVMLFEVDYEQESLLPTQERLITDLGKALGQECQKITSLKWPMLDASHVNQDQSAADQVIQARLNSSLTGKEHLLLFGELPQQIGKRFGQSRVKRLAVEDLRLYLSEPLKKKALWLKTAGWLEQV